MSIRSCRFIAPVLRLAASLVQAGTLPTPPSTAVKDINPTELREHLAFLASPELGGRYTLSPSLPIAARYLATRLQAWGYKPGGDGGSYFQHFPLISSKPKPDECWLAITENDSTANYKFGDFFSPDAKSGAADAVGEERAGVAPHRGFEDERNYLT